ncbi:hypothetical protein BC834DRAFT_267676 [Gloeopeniophorella convolvens]|nr:hypothetical protein BC834DRAFT_267676 [Gloeopeniophorella convolvens]
MDPRRGQRIPPPSTGYSYAPLGQPTAPAGAASSPPGALPPLPPSAVQPPEHRFGAPPPYPPQAPMRGDGRAYQQSPGSYDFAVPTNEYSQAPPRDLRQTTIDFRMNQWVKVWVTIEAPGWCVGFIERVIDLCDKAIRKYQVRYQKGGREIVVRYQFPLFCLCEGSAVCRHFNFTVRISHMHDRRIIMHRMV